MSFELCFGIHYTFYQTNHAINTKPYPDVFEYLHAFLLKQYSQHEGQVSEEYQQLLEHKEIETSVKHNPFDNKYRTDNVVPLFAQPTKKN